jgi:hypothetical protein
MCQIKSERATGEHHPPQLVMLWKSTQHITRKMGLRYISCGGTSPTATGDVVEIHATHHQKNGWLRYITHVLVMINRKPFHVLVMI